MAGVDLLKPFDTWPPTHGPNGSPVVESEVEAKTEIQEHEYLPPSEPGRTVYTYDDDGEIIDERERSDEEFATAVAAYEKARVRWNETNGLVLERGPTTHTARVKCADGSGGAAIGDGRGGRWVECWGPESQKPDPTA